MPIDPELFMNATVDAPLPTERTLCPPGEYEMYIDDFTKDAFETFEFEYKRGPKAGTPGSMTKFNCPIIVADESVKKTLDMDRVIVFRSMTLEFEDDDITLKKGKNVNIELGQLRHAVGQNHDGPWALSQLRGAGPFKGRVEHREGKRKDGSQFKVAEVTRVAPIR